MAQAKSCKSWVSTLEVKGSIQCIYCKKIATDYCQTCNQCNLCCPSNQAPKKKASTYKPCHHCGAPINCDAQGTAATNSTAAKGYGKTWWWCLTVYKSYGLIKDNPAGYIPFHAKCGGFASSCNTCLSGGLKLLKPAKAKFLKDFDDCKGWSCSEKASCDNCFRCSDCCYCEDCNSCGEKGESIECSRCGNSFCNSCLCSCCLYCNDCREPCASCGNCSDGGCSCYNEPDVALEIWGIDPQFKLDYSIAKFYLLNHLVAVAPSQFQAQFDTYAQEFADMLARYLDMVVGGEIRYGSETNRAVTDLMPRIAKRVTRRQSRGSAWAAWAELRKEYGLEILEEAETALMGGDWGGGVGGEAWGKVAMHLRKYLEGEYPPFMFVDIAVDLEHNNGCIFNKVWYTKDTKALLDAKFNGRLLRSDMPPPELKDADGKTPGDYKFFEQYGIWGTPAQVAGYILPKKTVGDFVDENLRTYYMTTLARARKYEKERGRELAYFVGNAEAKPPPPTSVVKKVDQEIAALRKRLFNQTKEAS